MKSVHELFVELCKTQLQIFQNMNGMNEKPLAEPEGNNIFSDPGDEGWGSLGRQDPNLATSEGNLRESLLAVNDAVAELQIRFHNNQMAQEKLSKLVNRLADIIEGEDPPPDEADFKEPEKKEGAQ